MNVLYSLVITSIVGVISILNAEPTYEYRKGQVLSPNYVHTQTLQVVEDFNLPDTCVTDLQIYNYIMSKTETLD
jgi:hypothetical protein